MFFFRMPDISTTADVMTSVQNGPQSPERVSHKSLTERYHKETIQPTYGRVYVQGKVSSPDCHPENVPSDLASRTSSRTEPPESRHARP